MFKKELSDSLKTLWIGIPFALLVVFLKVFLRRSQSFFWDADSLLNLTFTSTTLIFAALAGLTLFRTEKRDRGYEYLFSLPYSRLKLLAFKVLPRLLILSGLFLIGGLFSVFDSFFADIFSILVVFCFSLFISLAVDSFFMGLMGVIILNNILYFVVIVIGYLKMDQAADSALVSPPGFFMAQFLPAVILLLGLGTAFWKTFKRLDLKPLNRQIGSYLLYVLPVIFIYLGFILLHFKGYNAWIGAL